MSTREECRQARIARLLEQVQSSAQAWAEAEYQVGIATGRASAVSAQLETIRGTAQRRFADVVARLAAAVRWRDGTRWCRRPDFQRNVRGWVSYKSVLSAATVEAIMATGP